ELARDVLGHSPTHVMLLHTTALNAAALNDVIEAFRAKGWHFVAARGAFDDPLYSMEPDIVPAGESIVWALAKQRGAEGLRYPCDEPAIRAHLRQHGVEAGPVEPRYGAEGEGPSIYLSDPEGNVVELKGPPARIGALPAAD